MFEPPFSFRLAEKKTAVHGQKKRALSHRKTSLRSFCRREWLVRSSGKIHQSSTGCAPLCSLNTCAPASSAAENFRGNGRKDCPSRLAAAPPAQKGGCRIYVPRGDEVQNKGARRPPWSGRFKGVRGGTAEAPPVVDEARRFRGSGTIGDHCSWPPIVSPRRWARFRNPPGFFFRGCGGLSLYEKRKSPTSLRLDLALLIGYTESKKQAALPPEMRKRTWNLW